MKRLLNAVVIGVTAFAASTSWSDVSTSNQPASPEPVTDTPSKSTQGDESPSRDPFQPYGIGSGPDAKTPKPFWSYGDLTPAEQAVVDKGRDSARWPAIHDAYNTGVAELAQRAASAAAVSRLGVSDLALTGVVP